MSRRLSARGRQGLRLGFFLLLRLQREVGARRVELPRSLVFRLGDLHRSLCVLFARLCLHDCSFSALLFLLLRGATLFGLVVFRLVRLDGLVQVIQLRGASIEFALEQGGA